MQLFSTTYDESAGLCRQTVLILASLLVLLPHSLAHASDTQVKRGERPPIKLYEVPVDAYEPGVVRIKFAEDHTSFLDNNTAARSEKNIMHFGLERVDELNDEFGVADINPTFASRSFQSRHLERHRRWGFHLWFDLYVDESEDVVRMVEAYEALPEITVAEPHYRKELIGDLNLGVDPPDPSLGLDGDDKKDAWIPDDPMFEDQWHYQNTGQHNGIQGADIRLPEAWSITRGSSDVIVGVIDGGIRHQHEDLQGAMWEDLGYNFVMDTTFILGTHHGTHVGGTIGARNNNDVGVSGVGGGWGDTTGVQLMSLQVFINGGGAGFEIAPIFAADHGAAISQNSWGYSQPGVYEEAVLDAIDYFNTHGGGDIMDGGLTITSAGNSGEDAEFYPGFYSGTIAVAATTNTDARAYYSNYGSWIDISAPGGENVQVNEQGVLSTRATGYGYAQGTSMACPHVSGVAALILSIAPNEFTAEAVQEILLDSADDHYAANPDYIGKLGTGRLNAHKALLIAEQRIISVSGFAVETENNHRAKLSWTPNQYNNPVLLAYNESPEFGEVSWDLQAGEPIPGGGVLLYKGDARAFSHVMPSHSENHHYKIWSHNTTTDATSIGRNAMAIRSADLNTMPYEEPFNQEVWPLGWDSLMVYSGTGQEGSDPQISLVMSGDMPDALPVEGSHMMAFNSAEARKEASVRLISPPVSTKGLDQARLDFLWFHHAADPQIQDRMTVQLSLDKENWTTIGVLNRFHEEEGWHPVGYSLSSHFLDREEIYVALLFRAERDEELTGGNMYLDHLRLYTEADVIIPAFISSPGEVMAGERVLFTSRSAGKNLDHFTWYFGDDAIPSSIDGEGPHEVVYLEPGSKDATLVINDTLSYTREDVVMVHASAFAPPDSVQATIENGDVVLSWEYHGQRAIYDPGHPNKAESRQSQEELFPDGYNLYRNGQMIEGIPDGETFSYTDPNVSEGWLRYWVTAYFDHPHQESPPGDVQVLAINAVTIFIDVDGGGSTLPPPGELPFLSGDSLSIRAIAAENHALYQWTIDGQETSPDNPLQLYIQDDTEIVAVFQDVTSVTNPLAQTVLQVYPNPASDGFSVYADSEILDLRLMDIHGRSVYYQQAQEDNIYVTTQGLRPGIYLLIVRTCQDTKTVRLVIN